MITVDGNQVIAPAGYLITPFIRVWHLMREIFGYFGYTLHSSWLEETSPFREMVLLNPNMDSLLTGSIRYSQLVPDCMVTTILDLFRVKFGAEFVPNETTKEVRIVLIKEVLSAVPSVDLSDRVYSNMTIVYPAKYKQLELRSEMITPPSLQRSVFMSDIHYDVVSSSDSETVNDILNRYPEAEINSISGDIVRYGFKGHLLVTQRLGSIGSPYNAGGVNEVETKEMTDQIPAIIPGHTQEMDGIDNEFYWYAPYIGKGRSLNSRVLKDGESDSGTIKPDELRPILCLSYTDADQLHRGTITNYSQMGVRLWDYHIGYNGQYGLFETFWRDYDNLLRNSLHEIKVDLLLSDVDKLSLSEVNKVIINGQEMLPNSFNYTTIADSIKECTLYTTRLYAPLSTAPAETDRLTGPKYKWEVKYAYSNPEFNPTMFFYDEEPVVRYYVPPTKSQFETGGKYYEQSYSVTASLYPVMLEEKGTLTVWLEAVLRG